MNRSLRFAPLCTSLLVLLALVGCGGGTGSTTDAGTDPTRDGGGGDVDGGGGDVDGGGGGGPTCAELAADTCAQFAECSPEIFIGAYEDMATCVEVISSACDEPIALTNGVTDPEACLEMRNASCDAFLDSRQSAACLPLPGDVAQDGACSVDAQCGMGTNSDGESVRLYCYGATSFACMDGVCAPPDRPMSGRNTCANSTTGRDNCDTLAGYQCVAEFDEDAPGHLDERGRTCLAVVYGGAGADCAAGSDHVCAPGFVCHAGTATCMAALLTGAACDPTASLCDARRGLTCQPDDDGNDVCTPPHFVRVGAQCGVVDGVTQSCSNYALCNSATPSICEARRALGETCTASPDNCRTGLVCEGGTCAEPEAPTCP